jgi:hypothetical protein
MEQILYAIRFDDGRYWANVNEFTTRKLSNIATFERKEEAERYLIEFEDQEKVCEVVQIKLIEME